MVDGFKRGIQLTEETLVSDTSVLIEMGRGGLLEACFLLPYRFCVPSLLYEQELEEYGGKDLQALGLQVIKLERTGVDLARDYRKLKHGLSLPDCHALALASINRWTILVDDKKMRNFARLQQVEYHGTLWLFDKIESAETVSLQDLLQGLKAIAGHPLCRQPANEIHKRRLRLQNKIQAGDAGNKPRQ